MLNRLITLISTLNNKPLFWASLYLALIFVFAGIYSKLTPQNFYHSTVQYEFEITAKEIQLSNIIENGIRQGFLEKPNTTGITLERVAVYDHNIRASGDRAFFTLYIQLKKGWREVGFFKHVSFVKTKRYGRQKQNDNCNVYVRVKADESTDNTVIMRDHDFQAAADHVFSPMVVSCDDAQALDEFIDTLNGFPRNLPNSYWRMFYFSVSTITTLGYGDIVPITDRSRGLVAIEAILGLVIIGCFLNSLANKSRRKV